MLKCCMSNKVLENVVSPAPLSVSLTSSSGPSLEVRTPTVSSIIIDTDPVPVPELVPDQITRVAPKKLLKLGAEPNQTKKVNFKGTVLHNDDVSPDLTPEEITKIQNNLIVLKKFYKDLYLVQGNIITEVWAILKTKSYQESSNTTATWLKNTLTTCGVLCSIIAVCFAATGVGIGFAIGAALIGALASYIGTNMESKEITGYDITGDMGFSAALNTKNFNHMTKVFDHFIDNTNDCRDCKFDCNGQSYTLRDLLKDDLKEGTLYDNLLILSGRVYRNSLVMPELTRDVTKQFLDLYFIQDVIRGENVDHGHCYQPCAAPIPPGIQRERAYNTNEAGAGAGIWSNQEVVHFNHCNQVDVYGTDNNDLTNSYLMAIKEFTQKMPSTFIYPWSVTSEKIYSQKFFIVMGYDKLRDDQNSPNYTLPENDFLNWLFIDDGAGHIINPEGVCFRYDALRAKTTLGMKNDVFLHAQQIGNEIQNVVSSGGVKCSSTDFRYGPKESSDLNKQYHVYAGDVKNIMKI